MPNVVLEMSMSVDGYVTGPDVSPDEPMGRGGERLHDWMFEGRTEAESEAFQVERFRDVGAVVVGRRMADLGLRFWGDEPVFRSPVFVVTNRPADPIEKAGGTSYTFVTGGIDEALRRAREAAGPADIVVGGGADIARQYLATGAIDELRLHLVPLILGGGTRLFEDGPQIDLRPSEVVTAPNVAHLAYEIERSPAR